MKDDEKLKQKVTLKKRAMLQALEKSLGVVSDAAKLIKINRKTHYEWLKKDEDYKNEVEALSDVALDFAESALHGKIKEGSDAAIIFYLKTKGKGRGYIERQEVLQGRLDVEWNEVKNYESNQKTD